MIIIYKGVKLEIQYVKEINTTLENYTLVTLSVYGYVIREEIVSYKE